MGDSSVPPEPDVDPADRRTSQRFDVLWSVDCEAEDTFLYASIANISEMGIFVRTTQPLSVGTVLTLRFSPVGDGASNGAPPMMLRGVVQWVNPLRALAENPNPGMGIRFIELSIEQRERLVELVRTIAYLREQPYRLN